MALSVQLSDDLKTAMKAGDSLRVSVLRMLLSELNYKKIDLQRDLNDEDVSGVIQKEVKKRREAVDSFNAGGRSEQAASENQEMEILQAYLPAQMSEEEVRRQIQTTISGLDTHEFGMVMKTISPMFRGKADGGMVAKIVKEILAG